ncbi:sodium:proton exchanger [Maribellus comscasis]|uniref:Sodium:proton exchanger n=1 Tax=Maribellus comscasis TaxID=2681766 RepID=A0A6I6JMA0_9BACT|nr:cation:proton antiporter [Maribellus comscasis]QGY42158.1 sodium:proton exchanger [Maribellus comscasis]
MEEFHINILNISAVLLSAYLGGVLIRKIGYPAILGELLIGIVLGPAVFGLLEYTESIKVLAEIGIVLLMVYIGMEIDFHDLKKASWPGLLAALGGFFVPFVLGYFTVIWYGGTPMAGLFVAIAIGVTSLATKSRILIDLKLLNTRIALVMMAGALISDTLALVIFSGITNFAESSSVNLRELFLISGKIILFFGVTISVGIFLLPRLGRYLVKSTINNSTAYFTMILIVTFGYCELAELAGMHSILGAFMAGLFLKDNLFPKNITKELNKAFYDVSIGFMAPIFFVSAGFFVDPTVFKTDLLLLFIITTLAIVGKIAGTALFYLPSGNGWREGITIGTGMNGRGAVEIIIAGIGLEMGIIDKTIFSILVFMAIFTTLTVPVLLNWTSKWLRRRGELVYLEKRNGLLILGVNPVSLLMAKYVSKKMPVTLVDNNREMVALAERMNFKCIYGNALDEDIITESNPGNIDTFVGLTPNSQVNLLVGRLMHESFLIPNMYVAVATTKSGVGTDVLKKFSVSTLFAKPVRLDTWFHLIEDQKVKETYEIVNKEISCSLWVEKYADNNILPLLVETENGTLKPFHSGGQLMAGEKVIFLRSRE